MSNEVLDEAGVAAKFGVPPGRIVDYLTLVGDAVDNVPGVAKGGPKTAVKWLAQYGSLDGIIAHADDIGGVVGQNLRDHLDFLPLGRKLVTVACDLSNLPAPAALTATDRDTETLRELYTRYEFRTWLRDLDAPASGPGTSDSRTDSRDTARRDPRQLRNRSDLAAIRRLAGQNRSRRTDRARYRNDQPRLLRRTHRRHFALGQGRRGLLHPARPHCPRRPRPVAARRSAGAPETLA